ncbi:ArgE/DapE family deacylase [Geopsychrobacter electrodiphilus]|uniref:ArgE/DapE family deacylase n=1 Tax=Geopsychrobacter electrodiphilus TaxID=225196 RepID=UPI00036A118C|nr:ArgE/DapE family deacylase [Geopsychrobacter electrodiphilus]
MPMTAQEQRIVSVAEELSEQMLDFACRLLAQPSTLGNEIGALEVVEQEFRQLGLSPERVAIDSPAAVNHPGHASTPWEAAGRYNLVATRQPVSTATGVVGRSALFNGHLDVVSPEPLALWNRDPFSPLVQDGWLYGRGAGDMKGGVAAMTYAVQAINAAGFALCGPVTLETVIEEECSGNGALACRAAGHDADAVLIPEPFGPTILTAQLGVLWFKVEVAGAPSHVLNTSAGANAIEKCWPLITALRGLEKELNEQDVPSAYRGIAHPINLNIGMVRGGDWPSTVPAAAEFHARLAFFPGVEYESVCRRIAAVIEAAAKSDAWLAANPPSVSFYGFRSQGHALSRDLPALQTLNGCHHSLQGSEAASYIACCTTDLRAFVHYGQGQATCYGPVAEAIHAANERVLVSSLVDTTKTYALFLARWCGLSE